MAKEIERKFLIKDEAWRSHVEATLEIRQFYVAATAQRTVRIRIRDNRTAFLTLKFGDAGPERDEYEYSIPLSDAEDMLRFALGNVIEKTRHHVRHSGRLCEIDVFAGALAGLVLCEIETPDSIPDIELPPWLGREVTNEAAYYNASLALHGLPRGAA